MKCQLDACKLCFGVLVSTICICFRALALRLNARVSELTLAAECARTDGESARAELQRVRQRHDSEVQALEKRQKQLVSALRAVGGQAQPLDLAQDSETRDPSQAQPLARTDSRRLEGASDALMAVRDRNQSQAIQEAELAVAVMQVVHGHFRDSWCDAVSHFPTGLCLGVHHLQAQVLTPLLHAQLVCSC